MNWTLIFVAYFGVHAGSLGTVVATFETLAQCESAKQDLAAAANTIKLAKCYRALASSTEK